MSPEEKLEFEEMKLFIQSLKSSTTIPYDIDSAFRARFATQGKISTKTVASETQAVDENGLATYNVPKLHDGYEEEVIEGTVIYKPYYNTLDGT